MKSRVPIVTWYVITVFVVLALSGAIITLLLTRKGMPPPGEQNMLLSLLNPEIDGEFVVSEVRKSDGSGSHGVIDLAGGFIADSQLSSFEFLTNAGVRITAKGLRDRILELFGTNSTYYSVIFKRSAADAIRLFVEAFPWTNKSSFWYHEDCDSTFLSLRRYAAQFDALHMVLNDTILSGLPSVNDSVKIDSVMVDKPDNLLGITLREGFSGKRLNRSLIRSVLRKSSVELLVANETCAVLADASDFAPANRLNLTDLPFHGVAVSFDRMFGFPHVGALIIQNEMFDIMNKRVFGAAALQASMISEDIEISSTDHVKAFEDAKMSSRVLQGLSIGLDIFQKLKIDNIENRLENLAEECFETLTALKHKNGASMIKIYSLANDTNVVTFNVMKADGTYVHDSDVVAKALQKGIIMQDGCHCSPACYKALNLSESAIRSHYANVTTCARPRDYINGVPVGAVKAEFTWSSSAVDVDALVFFLNATYYESSV